MNDSPCYSIILCEGYRDRAFWAGWLETNGWEDARPEQKKPAKDPYGQTQSGSGKYAYYAKNRSFVVVIPTEGESHMDEFCKSSLDSIEGYIRKSDACNLHRIILSVDSDVKSDQPNPTMNAERVKNLVQKANAKVAKDQSVELSEPIFRDGHWHLFEGKCVVSVVRWQAESDLAEGIPEKQVLERLVCVAMCEAYPERAKIVENWLEDKKPKSYAWAYMARFYAEQGCDDFYQLLWRDEKRIAERLKEHLTNSGAWAVFESLQV